MSKFSTFETVIPVRPDDIDMNQHVHNSRYFDYVLAARYDQMKRCYKMSMVDFINRDLSWVVKASYMEHKRPLRIGDTSLVRTHVDRIEKANVKVNFEIVKGDDSKLVAKGWFEYVMVALQSGRPQQIPEDIVEKYSI